MLDSSSSVVPSVDMVLNSGPEKGENSKSGNNNSNHDLFSVDVLPASCIHHPGCSSSSSDPDQGPPRPFLNDPAKRTADASQTSSSTTLG
ncbi:unnamed protein product, partial [Amoebophrya sp. A120]|eukprot:GSA120T00008669001.1